MDPRMTVDEGMNPCEIISIVVYRNNSVSV